jgi:hypothetical protein
MKTKKAYSLKPKDATSASEITKIILLLILSALLICVEYFINKVDNPEQSAATTQNENGTENDQNAFYALF